MKSFDWNNFGSDDTYKINSVENVVSEQVITESETSEGSEALNDSYFAELNINVNKAKATSSESSTNASSLFKNYTMKVSDEESSVKASSFGNKMAGSQTGKKKGYGLKVFGQLIYIAAAIIILILALDSAEKNKNYSGSVIEERNADNMGQELHGYEYIVRDGVVRKVRRKVGNTVTNVLEFNAVGEKIYDGKPNEEHK